MDYSHDTNIKYIDGYGLILVHFSLPLTAINSIEYRSEFQAYNAKNVAKISES